jgi:4'-phosphopantetheinyl transferase EntD
MPASFRSLLPPSVAVAEGPIDASAPWAAGLHPEEARLVENAVARRRAEFGAGRRRMREALALLGIEAGVIGVGAHREPLLPPGVSATITHTREFCAAAAARIARDGHVGIDAESLQPLEDGVAALVLRPEERAESQADPCRAAVLFCAKEAFYKAFFQVCARYLDFQEARVRLQPASGAFELEIHAEGFARPCDTIMRGRHAIVDGTVLAAVVLDGGDAEALRRYFAGPGL